MRILEILLAASTSLLVAACTIVPADSGRSTTDAGTSDVPNPGPPSSTVPPQLAGATWSWVSGAGAQELSFASDGSYTSDVFLDAHPGESCGTEYFTRRIGTATFEGDAVTLTPTTSTRRKSDSCSDTVVSETAIENTVASYRWQLEDGTLVLIDAEGSETRYERSGS